MNISRFILITASLTTLVIAMTACQSTGPTAETIDRTVPAFVQESEIDGVYNFSRISQGPGFGGATDPAAMSALKAQGFTTVISLRTEGEKGFDPEAARIAAEAAGLEYIHLPFNTREPATDIVQNFIDAVDDPDNQPPYIHCGSATRVAALWMIKRIEDDGMPRQAAQAEAEAIAGKPEAAVAWATGYLEEKQD